MFSTPNLCTHFYGKSNTYSFLRPTSKRCTLFGTLSSTQYRAFSFTACAKRFSASFSDGLSCGAVLFTPFTCLIFKDSISNFNYREMGSQRVGGLRYTFNMKLQWLENSSINLTSILGKAKPSNRGQSPCF